MRPFLNNWKSCLHLPKQWMLPGDFAGRFEGTPVYESRKFAPGEGLALPGLGIIVFPGAFSLEQDLDLVRHEFGHILQARRFGLWKFYTEIGPRSLRSAMGKRVHREYWTEVNANRLAFEYFGCPSDWPGKRFPLGY